MEELQRRVRHPDPKKARRAYYHASALLTKNLLAHIVMPRPRGRPFGRRPPSSLARRVWLARHYKTSTSKILSTIKHATGITRDYRWVETQVQQTKRLIATGVVDLKRVLRPYEALAPKERERRLLDEIAGAARREMRSPSSPPSL